jgi:hypothetical protein
LFQIMARSNFHDTIVESHRRKSHRVIGHFDVWAACRFDYIALEVIMIFDMSFELLLSNFRQLSFPVIKTVLISMQTNGL